MALQISGGITFTGGVTVNFVPYTTVQYLVVGGGGSSGDAFGGGGGGGGVLSGNITVPLSGSLTINVGTGGATQVQNVP